MLINTIIVIIYFNLNIHTYIRLVWLWLWWMVQQRGDFCVVRKMVCVWRMVWCWGQWRAEWSGMKSTTAGGGEDAGSLFRKK